MKIAPFGVEQWMNEWETGAVTNLAETCVDSFTMNDLLNLTGGRDRVVEEMLALRLSYGDIKGSERLLSLVAGLYKNQSMENAIIMNGGSAANFIGLYTLVEPGDEVVCVYPTYQQLYSIPESFGAKVGLLRLKPEQGFLPDVDELKSLVTPRTKLICINNSNNPTGSLMERPLLEEIAAVADSVGAWLFCDEAYRFMAHSPQADAPSVPDLYERGVASCSLSKCFALAGLRTGWLVGHKAFIDDVFMRRDYTTISVARIDDMLACIALENRDKILDRNLSIVRKCSTILDNWIEREEHFDYVKPQAGTTAFLHYDYDIAARDFCRRLFERDGTFLLPGECFGPEFDRYLRIGYAYSPDVLEEGLARVSNFTAQL